jgi:hypothetical protein
MSLHWMVLLTVCPHVYFCPCPLTCSFCMSLENSLEYYLDSHGTQHSGLKIQLWSQKKGNFSWALDMTGSPTKSSTGNKSRRPQRKKQCRSVKFGPLHDGILLSCCCLISAFQAFFLIFCSLIALAPFLDVICCVHLRARTKILPDKSCIQIGVDLLNLLQFWTVSLGLKALCSWGKLYFFSAIMIYIDHKMTLHIRHMT